MSSKTTDATPAHLPFTPTASALMAASNAALAPWQQAADAWSRAAAMGVAAMWPWALMSAPGGEGRRPSFRTHAPGTPLDRLSVGDSASTTRTITQDDIDAFALISGDDNPAHVDHEWAADSHLGGTVAHGMLTAGLISAVLGTQLPGPGSIYMSQSLKWLAPVFPGDELTATVTIREIDAERGRVVLDTVVESADKPVLVGEALIKPPRE